MTWPNLSIILPSQGYQEANKSFYLGIGPTSVEFELKEITGVWNTDKIFIKENWTLPPIANRTGQISWLLFPIKTQLFAGEWNLNLSITIHSHGRSRLYLNPMGKKNFAPEGVLKLKIMPGSLERLIYLPYTAQLFTFRKAFLEIKNKPKSIPLNDKLVSWVQELKHLKIDRPPQYYFKSYWYPFLRNKGNNFTFLKCTDGKIASIDRALWVKRQIKEKYTLLNVEPVSPTSPSFWFGFACYLVNLKRTVPIAFFSNPKEWTYITNGPQLKIKNNPHFTFEVCIDDSEKIKNVVLFFVLKNQHRESSQILEFFSKKVSSNGETTLNRSEIKNSPHSVQYHCTPQIPACRYFRIEVNTLSGKKLMTSCLFPNEI